MMAQVNTLWEYLSEVILKTGGICDETIFSSAWHEGKTLQVGSK